MSVPITLEDLCAQIDSIKQQADFLVDGLCAQRDEARNEVTRLRAALERIAWLGKSDGYAVDAQAVASEALKGCS